MSSETSEKQVPEEKKQQTAFEVADGSITSSTSQQASAISDTTRGDPIAISIRRRILEEGYVYISLPEKTNK